MGSEVVVALMKRNGQKVGAARIAGARDQRQPCGQSNIIEDCSKGLATRRRSRRSGRLLLRRVRAAHKAPA